MTALLLALLLAPPDTVLAEVVLVQTRRAVLVEAVQSDSVLLFPAPPLYELFDVGPPTAPWTTVAELQAQFPAVTFAWVSLEQRLYVSDPLTVFPASRRAQERQLVSTRYALSIAPWSGPMVSLQADERGAYATDLGYVWRGRIWATWRESSRSGSTWSASVSPAPWLYASYQDGDLFLPSTSVRVAAGPAWVSGAWTPIGWYADGLVQLGRVSLFASTRETYAVTINRPPLAVQAGRAGNINTFRLTWGPIAPSPFSVPMIP